MFTSRTNPELTSTAFCACRPVLLVLQRADSNANDKRRQKSLGMRRRDQARREPPECYWLSMIDDAVQFASEFERSFADGIEIQTRSAARVQPC